MPSFLQYKLEPPTLENDFRLERGETDRRHLATVLLLAIVFMTSFLVLTIVSPAKGENTLLPIAIRLFGIFAGLFGLWRIRNGYHFAKDEKPVFVSILAIVLHLVAENVRDPDFMHVVPWDIVAIFAIYSVVALRTLYQIFLAAFLSLGSLTLWLAQAAPELPLDAAIAPPLAYIAANCFGLALSLNTNKNLRQEFLARQQEKSLAKNLEKTTRQLRETMSTRDQLFSVIAHDLRGPIGALGSIGEYLLTDESKNEAGRNKLINLLCKAATSSHDLLENLLSWALSETGDLRPDLQPVDLANVVESNVRLLEVTAAKKQIELQNACRSDTRVIADPKMLNTVVRNLISNALKFTHPGGRVQITQQTGPNQLATLQISDNGTGIDPERLPNIFQLDFKSTTEGTHGEAGSNLGLRLCSQFIQKQGGRIWADSQPGKGSRFSFSLPIADESNN